MTCIQFKLITTRQEELATMVISIRCFKDAQVFDSSEDMLDYVRSLIPREYYISKRVKHNKGFQDKLECLRINRRKVLANVYLSKRRTKTSSLPKDIEKSKKQIESLKKDLAKARTQRDEAKLSLRKNKKELTSIKKQVREFESQFDKLSKSNTDLAVRNSELMEELKEVKTENQNLVNKYGNLPKKNLELSNKIKDLEKELKALKNKKNEKPKKNTHRY